MPMLQNIIHRIGRITCGQMLAWSVALNAVLLTGILLVNSVPDGLDDGASVPAKAAQLEYLRDAAR